MSLRTPILTAPPDTSAEAAVDRIRAVRPKIAPSFIRFPPGTFRGPTLFFFPLPRRPGAVPLPFPPEGRRGRLRVFGIADFVLGMLSYPWLACVEHQGT